MNPDKKILVVSTDPAHSLSDSLDCKIGDKITPIHGFDNLYGLEINIHKVHKEFLLKHGVDMFILASRVPYIDKELVSGFIKFTLPGMDELGTILKIIDILSKHEYDLVILDTAPTGHTLRLLELPDIMSDMIRISDKSQERYRYGIARFSRKKYVKDEADGFLDRLRADIKGLSSILKDPDQTEFVPITIPEAMGVYETGDLITALDKHNISVRCIIINGVNPQTECVFCQSRRKAQDKYIDQVYKNYTKHSIIKMPLFPHEIRGIQDLNMFADILFKKPYEYRPAYVKPSAKRPAGVTTSIIEKLLKTDLQFILFGGKGGVGKTTCAAAAALYLARIKPDNKILVFSTDPAHSLSDSFDCEIGSKATPLPGHDNLYGLEIDPKEVFNEFKKPFLKEINATIDAMEEGGVNLSFERRLVSDLFSISPPGLDELMAGSNIMDLIKNNEYSMIILDTAPTGHTLRLLELPQIVTEWFDKLIRYLIEYADQERASKNIKEIMKLLLETKERILNTQKMLKNPENTGFVVVTIPEAMGVLETERLMLALQNLGIHSNYIIINKFIPLIECSFCASRREEQEKYIRQIKELFSETAITEVPLFPGEVRGMNALLNLAEMM